MFGWSRPSASASGACPAPRADGRGAPPRPQIRNKIRQVIDPIARPAFGDGVIDDGAGVRRSDDRSADNISDRNTPRAGRHARSRRAGKAASPGSSRSARYPAAKRRSRGERRRGSPDRRCRQSRARRPRRRRRAGAAARRGVAADQHPLRSRRRAAAPSASRTKKVSAPPCRAPAIACKQPPGHRISDFERGGDPVPAQPALTVESRKMPAPPQRVVAQHRDRRRGEGLVIRGHSPADAVDDPLGDRARAATTAGTPIACASASARQKVSPGSPR